MVNNPVSISRGTSRSTAMDFLSRLVLCPRTESRFIAAYCFSACAARMSETSMTSGEWLEESFRLIGIGTIGGFSGLQAPGSGLIGIGFA